MTLQRHLRDMLSEEQAPFALQSFIDERRCQLQPPKSSHFFLDANDKPSSTAASLLLDAALKNHGVQVLKQHQKRSKVKQLGLRFFSSLLSKLFQKKPRSQEEVEEEAKYEPPSHQVGCSRAQEDMARAIEGEGMEISGAIDDLSVSRSPPAENRPPALADGQQSTTEKKVLVGEDEGGGGGADELLQEKQQLSPVSVLFFHDNGEEEDDDQKHHRSQKDGDDQEESFQHSLAIVQRSKEQLMRQIRRFERLAGLDPVQLDELLSDDQTNDHENANLEKEVIYEFARVLLECPHEGHCIMKLPMDTKKLLTDLIENEKEEVMELDAVVERVYKKFEAWKEMSCMNVELLVELDYGHDG